MYLLPRGYAGAQCGRLSVSGHNLVKDGQRVFLSGANLAWYNYGQDFGNNHYAGVRSHMEQFLSQIQASGGNSIRESEFSHVFLYYNIPFCNFVTSYFK